MSYHATAVIQRFQPQQDYNKEFSITKDRGDYLSKQHNAAECRCKQRGLEENKHSKSGSLNKALRVKSMTTKTKPGLFGATINSVLLYGSESWATTKTSCRHKC